MNNTDEIDFWIFGEARIPKLTILGAMFGTGLLLGFLAGRPGKKINTQIEEAHSIPEQNHLETKANSLSDEDRDYIR